MQTRTDLLNYLIQKNHYQTYLEIGISNGDNFNAIIIQHKEGVDPAIDTTHRMTSDNFFAINKNKFDIVFIDGLHLAEQAMRDVENSLKILNSNGIIILHDCNPTEEVWQNREWDLQKQPLWTGDVWKTLVKLRTVKNLLVGVVNIDFGCGFVKNGLQQPIKLPQDLTYSLLEANRKEWLNLMSPEEFVKTRQQPMFI